jgi:hypothetical protein
MSARDLPDLAHAQAVARGRIALLMTAIIPKLDAVLLECAAARCSAPGILEIIDWAEHALTEVAAAAAPPLDVRPDPVKDACAAAVTAARSGNPTAYAAARANEAAARAGA